MKTKFRISTLLLSLIFLCLSLGALSSCKSETYGIYTLVADFSNGSPEPLHRFYEVELTKPLDDKSFTDISMELAGHLSSWTGLNFTLNSVTLDGDKLIVDWSENSTLMTGIGRVRREDFDLEDAASVNWFMMDSLASTLKQNAPFFAGMEVTVYYNSDGKPLQFANSEEMALIGMSGLPTDQPYEGSAFFVALANGAGKNPLSITWGGVYMNADETIRLGIGSYDGKSFDFLFTVNNIVNYEGVAELNYQNPLYADYEDYVFSFDGSDTITISGEGFFEGVYQRESESLESAG
ncbi:MAG: hypothetical protein FWH08_01305 [Oscillospiraceae bacterium]|nr:hypothetical protein [Oscillospiraceae bacterium]